VEAESLLEEVRRYYDRNSARFERHGASGASIHRAVWGPGITTRSGATRFVDDLILEQLRELRAVPTVLDLGCGIGESLAYLARRQDLVAEGITISPVQAARANERFRHAGLERIRCREANFLSLPADLRDVDLAFSIEAFVHSPNAAGYFSEAARVLRKSGRLFVCDDFLTKRAAVEPSENERSCLDDFRRGWRVGSLITVANAVEVAQTFGLRCRSVLDLTQFLELGRPRDRLIRLLTAVGKHLPISGEYWNALVGGNALQSLLESGAVSYSVLAFERTAAE
jgi:cyclopropane fatty-acyl-phospholipid synthase-like methyltransferase